MKLVKEDVAYVSKNDILFLRVFPTCVFNEIKFFDSCPEELIEFHHLDSINYWKAQEAIVDFGDIHSLSDDEISKKIIEYNEQLNNLGNEYLRSSYSYRMVLDKDRKRVLKVKALKHLIETLKDYLANKETYTSIFFDHL